MVTRFIELAGEINTSMPAFVVQRASEVLNEHAKPLKNSRILLLGLAYKANVDDYRESPTFKVMELLEEKGAITTYHDPFIPEIGPSREYARFTGRRSSDLNGIHDLIILCTAHDQYKTIDLNAVTAPVLDTRGVYPDLPGKLYRG